MNSEATTKLPSFALCNDIKADRYSVISLPLDTNSSPKLTTAHGAFQCECSKTVVLFQ